MSDVSDWHDNKPTINEQKPELSDLRVAGASGKDTVKHTHHEEIRHEDMQMDMVNQATKNMQSDAPACNVCGHITVRNGTCYKCLNCGNSLGCS